MANKQHWLTRLHDLTAKELNLAYLVGVSFRKICDDSGSGTVHIVIDKGRIMSVDRTCAYRLTGVDR